jgi:voltage-gated potassium channel
VGSLNPVFFFRHPEFRSIRIALLLIVLILSCGTAGYVVLEAYPIFDAFYMTVITVGTVGFMEVHPLSDAGRMFTSLLILSGLGTFAYSLTAVTSSIVGGEIKSLITGYKVNTQIENLENHVVICGYGRNGSQAALSLIESETPFVVIENDMKLCAQLVQEGKILCIQGDATDDEVLLRAGILKARALITTLDKDTNNLFVVLSVRNMNPGIQIISRASEENSDQKLRIAGADSVIMPDKIGGAHMAALVSRPDLIEFIDYLSSHRSAGEMRLNELQRVQLKEAYEGKSMHTLNIHGETGATFIALRNLHGEIKLNPADTEILKSGQTWYVLGNSEQIKKLKSTYCRQA